MPQTGQIFRVFVSSTFSDLVEERNALQEQVFPRLRALCESHGCHFQAIDLRWGISEEAALDQQTMKICLSEVVRCQRITPRPNFIVLLGDRYGWHPLPHAIPAAEFESILPLVPGDGQALFDQWYRLDDNAVPAQYGCSLDGVARATKTMRPGRRKSSGRSVLCWSKPRGKQG